MNTRNKFRIIATSSDQLILDIWAQDMDEAWEIAEEIDAGEYRCQDGNWDIEEVIPADEFPNFQPAN